MNEKTTAVKRYVGVKENLAYGFANAGQVFGYNLFAGGYLSLFFIKVFGIPEQAVATMILVLGIWDTVNDPLMGVIVDRHQTKWGKYKPYILFAAPFIAVLTVLMFVSIVYMFIILC